MQPSPRSRVPAIALLVWLVGPSPAWTQPVSRAETDELRPSPPASSAPYRDLFANLDEAPPPLARPSLQAPPPAGSLAEPWGPCDGCPPRRVGTALLQTTYVNVLYGLANLIRGQDTAKITPKTWWTNMKSGFEWDLDTFAVNQIGHPYQGNNYFTTGRGNGLGFWESAALTAFGSGTWEYFGETNRASLNDFINTTLGGIALGEMFCRSAWLIRDTRATGGGRLRREIVATALDPMTGLNRFRSGDAARVAEKPQGAREAHRERAFPAVARLSHVDGVLMRVSRGSLVVLFGLLAIARTVPAAAQPAPPPAATPTAPGGRSAPTAASGSSSSPVSMSSRSATSPPAPSSPITSSPTPGLWAARSCAGRARDAASAGRHLPARRSTRPERCSGWPRWRGAGDAAGPSTCPGGGRRVRLKPEESGRAAHIGHQVSVDQSTAR